MSHATPLGSLKTGFILFMFYLALLIDPLWAMPHSLQQLQRYSLAERSSMGTVYSSISEKPPSLLSVS
jgi:hypothetical protein